MGDMLGSGNQCMHKDMHTKHVQANMCTYHVTYGKETLWHTHTRCLVSSSALMCLSETTCKEVTVIDSLLLAECAHTSLC